MNTGSVPKSTFPLCSLLGTPNASFDDVSSAGLVNHVFAKPSASAARVTGYHRSERLVPAVLDDDLLDGLFEKFTMRTEGPNEPFLGRNKGSNVMWQKVFSTLKANANQVFVGFNLDNGGGGFLLLPKNLVIDDKSIHTPGETILLNSIISILIPEVFSQGKVRFTNDIDALKTLLEAQTACIVQFKENNPKSIEGRCLEILLPA